MENDNEINYEEFINLIKNNLISVMEENYSFYNGYNVHCMSELAFIKEQEKSKNDIYIVVKFLTATANFGQSVIPVRIMAMSESNKLTTCQKLLTDLALKYNLKYTEDQNIEQNYEIPTVSSNFNYVYDGIRSLLTCSATFVVSNHANYFTLFYNGEEVNTISNNFGGNISLDSQCYYNTGNFTKSTSKFGTNTISITTYLLDNIPLVNDCLEIISKNRDIDNDFDFSIVFRNGFKIQQNFKLADYKLSQNIAQLPIIVLSFTN